MGCRLDDAAVVHHHDAVAHLHRGQAMGDDDGGAVLHQPLERVLHHALALGVERRGGLVEQQQRGLAQQGAGDRDALALAAGEPDAALAQRGGEAFGQAVEEFGGMGGFGRGAHLGVARLGPAVADVLRRGAGEDHRLLGHQADAPAQCGGIGLGDIDAVEQEPSLLGIVEAQQQLEDRRLAGARGADQRQLLPAPPPRDRSLRRRAGPGGWDS